MAIVQGTSAAAARALPGARPGRRFWAAGLQGSEFRWAVAFVVPYIAIFIVFVIYPILYGFWLGGKPSLYPVLFSDPVYEMTVVNTLLFVGFGVNVRNVIALLLSGFFMRKGWWVKALLMIFVLPWAVPMMPTFIALHWMFDGDYGLLNNLLWTLFHIDGAHWLDTRWLALGSAIVSFIWKWMPFWTIILLAGRMAIPTDIYEAAKVDGATGVKSFFHITVPMLANLYLMITLISTIWTLGDFNTIYFVTGGGPAMSTYVLANLGIRDAFDLAEPRLGVAAVLTALPVLIPLTIVLMRKLKHAEVQL